ncbi:MAG TPA: hypothetical protein VLS93_15260 [Anaeromyxobacteraceae bacterium]|nr:hypothetical protein [Anaeromyxobacteraceae bacterium]
MRLPTIRLVHALALAAALATAACGGGGGGDVGGGSGGLSLDRSSVAFSAAQFDPLPATQRVQVTVTHRDAAYITAVHPPGVPQATWLGISLFGSGGNWTLALNVFSTGLAPATYTTTVRVVIARADGSVIAYGDVQVSYEVSAAIAVTPATLSFSHVMGGPTETGPLTVGGSTGVAWTASPSQPWVTLSAVSGTTPSTVTVGLDPAGLGPGRHDAEISVIGAGRTVVVPVTLAVAAPALVLSPGSLAFSGVNGAPIATKTFAVSVNNGTAVPFTVTPGAGWVVVGQAAGTTPATVTVGVDPSAGPLASGAHASTVTVAATAGGSPLSASLDVSASLARATLSVPASLLLGGADGKDFGGTPVQLSLDTGANAFPWTATASDGWIALSTTSGSASASPTTVTVTPSPAGLTGGTRTGSIAFAATVNGDTVTASVPVTFNLDSHLLLASATGVAFTSTPGPSLLARTLTVADNLGLAAPWAATSDAAWLSVTASGAGGDDLVLTADPTGLVPDQLHLARVTVSSSDPTVENTETIRVGLWIGSAAPAASVGVSGPFTEVVADPIRPYVYAHAGGSSVSIYNVHTGTLVQTITAAAGAAAGMAVSGDGSTLYVVDRATWRLRPIDLDTRSVGAAWSLASTSNIYPHVAWMRTGGQPLVIAADGALRDAADGTILASYRYPSYDSPYRVTASPDGSIFCDPACRPVTWTSLGGGTFTIHPTTVFAGSSDGAFSPDGSVIYRPEMSGYKWVGYDVATGQLVLQLGGGPDYAYPVNVEVGWDGRIICGQSSALSYRPDTYVFSPDGMALGSFKVESMASYPLDQQAGRLVISGDGLRVASANSGYGGIGELRFVTLP